MYFIVGVGAKKFVVVVVVVLRLPWYVKYAANEVIAVGRVKLNNNLLWVRSCMREAFVAL